MNKKQMFKYSIFSLIILIIFSSLTYLHNISKSRLLVIYDLNKLSKLSNEFVYFSDINCVNCRNFEPLLKEILVEENLEIYNFSISDFMYNSTKNISEEKAKLELKKVLKKYNITEIPTIIKLDNNGNVASSFTITSSDNQYIKNKTKEFLSQNQKVFIPHDIVEISLLILLVVLIILILIFKNDKTLNILALILTIIIAFSIYYCFSNKAIYIDTYGIYGKNNLLVIILLTIILSLTSSIISIRNLIKNK